MVDSANDLSIEVFLLKKKYDVDAFYTVVNELLDEFGIDAIEDDSPENLMSVEDRITVNIGKKITNELKENRNKMNDETIDEFVCSNEFGDQLKMQDEILKQVWNIAKTYRYTNFVEECNDLRKNFMEERSSYISHQFSGTAGILSVVFAQTRVPEKLFSVWLRTTIEKKEGYVAIQYEGLDGKIYNVNVIHTDDEPPKEKIVGQNPCDSFMLQYFWDSKKWIEIPIKMIISVDNNDCMDIDFNDDGGNILA